MYRYVQDMAIVGTNAMTRLVGSGVTTVIVVLKMTIAWNVTAAAIIATKTVNAHATNVLIILTGAYIAKKTRNAVALASAAAATAAVAATATIADSTADTAVVLFVITNKSARTA
jgi:hypothetical protein